IDPGSQIGVLASECGFEPYDRDDGLHPPGRPASSAPYNAYLRSKGYDGANPWETWANSGQAPDGDRQSGWLLVHADKQAPLPAHGDKRAAAPEGAPGPRWTPGRPMQFIAEAGPAGPPWLLHLSYIKPHWPYIAPAPYHAMYDRRHVVPPIRSEGERGNDAHP